ncbi:hypothetical protein LMA00_00105 [Burkholderia ambifaria]|uniref:hypothetical protein n=1 Tax=Burkholderia ambifaria TaxID=152480 RepID=UPI001E5F899F|nr:hypothetical protein [Burkholderia ambifaria]UEP48212.1 hypothetical protein LMA00_00105 [Burkholderia ambifaria]
MVEDCSRDSLYFQETGDEMPLINCPSHGYVGGELVTQAVSDLVGDRSRWSGSRRIVPLTLLRDEIEYPGYMLESEETKMLALGGKYAGGSFYRFNDDESMDAAIGLLTATCVECLRELMAVQKEG